MMMCVVAVVLQQWPVIIREEILERGNVQFVVDWKGSVSEGLGQGKGRFEVRDEKGDILLAFKGRVKDGHLIKGTLRCKEWEYKGSFEDGLFSGQGYMKWLAMHTAYDGEWKAGLFNGKGKLFDTERNVYHEGDFKNGQRHGPGRVYVWALDPEVHHKLEAAGRMDLVAENNDVRLMGYQLVLQGVWENDNLVETGKTETK